MKHPPSPLLRCRMVVYNFPKARKQTFIHAYILHCRLTAKLLTYEKDVIVNSYLNMFIDFLSKWNYLTYCVTCFGRYFVAPVLCRSWSLYQLVVDECPCIMFQLFIIKIVCHSFVSQSMWLEMFYLIGWHFMLSVLLSYCMCQNGDLV